jgi:hypothetical protein
MLAQELDRQRAENDRLAAELRATDSKCAELAGSLRRSEELLDAYEKEINVLQAERGGYQDQLVAREQNFNYELEKRTAEFKKIEREQSRQLCECEQRTAKAQL